MASPILRSSLQITRLREVLTLTRAPLSLSALVRSERKFTKKHEWVTFEKGVGTVGITDFAAAALGDIVYVELPDVGKELSKGDSFGAVESVKAASDIYTPISGTVSERNEALEENPQLINKSPFDKGWICKLTVKDESELKDLLNEAEYNKFKEEEEAAH